MKIGGQAMKKEFEMPVVEFIATVEDNKTNAAGGTVIDEYNCDEYNG